MGRHHPMNSPVENPDAGPDRGQGEGMRSLVAPPLPPASAQLSARPVARLLASLALLCALAVPGPPPAGATGARPGGELLGALGVLHGWDARRSAAWRTSDPVALRSLYAQGSRAGAADVRLLRAYDDHALVVRRIWTQVFAVRVLRHASDTWRLRVFDRVAGGTAERAGIAVPLPSTRPVTRLVDLRRERGRWVVVETWG